MAAALGGTVKAILRAPIPLDVDLTLVAEGDEARLLTSDGGLVAEAMRVEDGLSSLAIVATSSPFIGLFGTVWGIMHAFQSIAQQKNTSLAVVAPSIAEALFATAIGLAAAIPAYIAYNKFSTDAGKFSGRLESFADELVTAIQRRLAERAV